MIKKVAVPLAKHFTDVRATWPPDQTVFQRQGSDEQVRQTAQCGSRAELTRSHSGFSKKRRASHKAGVQM